MNLEKVYIAECVGRDGTIWTMLINEKNQSAQIQADIISQNNQAEVTLYRVCKVSKISTHNKGNINETRKCKKNKWTSECA